MTFSGKHDEELYMYFADASGVCGLRSSMGGQLEAMAAAALHPIPRNGDFMPVASENRHANRDFDVSDQMRAAVRELGRIEVALRRMHVAHVQVLRAHYADPKKASEHELALLLGSSRGEVQALKERAESQDREVRRVAKAELGSAVYRAHVALEVAQAAYVVAVEEAASAALEERKARFEAGLT